MARVSRNKKRLSRKRKQKGGSLPPPPPPKPLLPKQEPNPVQTPPKQKPVSTASYSSYGGGESWFSFLWRFFTGY